MCENKLELKNLADEGSLSFFDVEAIGSNIALKSLVCLNLLLGEVFLSCCGYCTYAKRKTGKGI